MVDRQLSLAVAAAVALSLGVAAQQAGSIRGTVYDREFNAPVPEAQVTIVETGQRVTTDAQGVFVFQQLRAGKYTLVVAKEGYVRQLRSDVLVTSGQLTDVAVELAGDFTDLEPFVVTDVLRIGAEGEAALLELRLESPALVNTISADMMSRAGAGDAAGALRLVSGASLQNGKTAVIRGLPDRYVSSQMNGVRLPSADEEKRAVELDQFPSDVISSIQVAKTFTPDQIGDASGGAVDVRLRGMPDEPLLFRWSIGSRYDTQVTGRSRFPTYRGGGLDYWGGAASPRGEQELGENWDGAVGVTEGDAPLQYDWSTALGGKFEVARGVRVGGLLNFFYERTTEFDDRARDDTYFGGVGGVLRSPLVPLTTAPVDLGAFRTQLLDIRRGAQSVQWGGLGTVGIETDDHALTLAYLFTRNSEDTATIADDTRGKQFFFPGYDPADPLSPGQAELFAAPYQRFQTLDYVERLTSTLQLSGRHRLPYVSPVRRFPVEIDWTIAQSSADRDQPDQRLLATQWINGQWLPLNPASASTLGNLQRIYRRVEEESDQFTIGVKVPFTQWTKDKGYLKFGFFRDKVNRLFDQNTFSNFSDPTSSFDADYDGLDWSANWPFEDHPISAANTDIDYAGLQQIEATYVMVDLPLTKQINLVGGVRWESTRVDITLDPEPGAFWLPPGELQEVALLPGQGDVSFDQDDVLPSVGLVVRPFPFATLRAAYNETIARQTFKELTPVLNQEFVGGPVFIGNPSLEMSSVRNYDLRLDLTPTPAGLVSLSYFRKDIENTIEYVEKSTTFVFTTAENYPRGTLSGYELELRQGLGDLHEDLNGLMVGGNMTWIDATVRLPDADILRFEDAFGERPRPTRDMTSAPDYLMNLFLTWDIESLGTQFGVFYTVQGDTLTTGTPNPTTAPPIYLTRYDTLNASLTQRLGDHLRLTFRARNLTDADRIEVYRYEFFGGDVVHSVANQGIEYSFSIGGEYRF